MKEPEYKVGDTVLLVNLEEFLELSPEDDGRTWRIYIKPWYNKALTIKKVYEHVSEPYYVLRHGEKQVNLAFPERDLRLIQRKN